MLKDILTGMPVVAGIIVLGALALNFPMVAAVVGGIAAFIGISGMIGSIIRG